MSGEMVIGVSSSAREDAVRPRLEAALAEGMLCRVGPSAPVPWWQFQKARQTYRFSGAAAADGFRATLETASEFASALNRAGSWTDSVAQIGRHRSRQSFAFAIQLRSSEDGTRLEASYRPSALVGMSIPVRVLATAAVIVVASLAFFVARMVAESTFDLTVDTFWLCAVIVTIVIYAVREARSAAGPELGAARHVLEVVVDPTIELAQVPIEFS
jgi:hypothetical protein